MSAPAQIAKLQQDLMNTLTNLLAQADIKENFLNWFGGLVERAGARAGGLAEDEYALATGNAYNEKRQSSNMILPTSLLSTRTLNLSENNLVQYGRQFLIDYYKKSAAMLILMDRVEKGEEQHPEQILQALLTSEKAGHKLDAMLADSIQQRRKDIAKGL